MALEQDILKLLKAEGYVINEAIIDALDEFIEIVEEENEDITADEDVDDEDNEVEED